MTKKDMQGTGPPEGCQYYADISDVPWDIQNTIAQHMSETASNEKSVLIDCFAGVGGNAIAFARSHRWKRIYAIERSPAAIACAKHNAKIYGVYDKISWYEGDCFSVLQKQLAGIGEHSVVFASPPWGGEIPE
ncbi:hypothetical protein ACLMJK_008079 [Lecanora helva]